MPSFTIINKAVLGVRDPIDVFQWVAIHKQPVGQRTFLHHTQFAW